MANKPKRQIPWVLVGVSFIFAAPLGFILLFLNLSGLLDKIDGSVKKAVDNARAEAEVQKYAVKRKKRSSTGRVLTLVFGIISAVITAFFGLSALITMESFAWIATLIFLALSAILFAVSGEFKKQDDRLSKICTIIGRRHSFNLTKLAAASGTTLKQIQKDVQKLIDEGQWGELSYIDVGTCNFMRNPDATPDDPMEADYDSLYNEAKKMRGHKKASKKATAEPVIEVSPETADDKEDFDAIIEKIRQLNVDILDEPVSRKIDLIEEHTRHIFDYVVDHPEAMPQIRTFLNYYLPTTLKLLESYKRIERVGATGENMKKSKKQIEDILDLLVVGFSQQVDQLFKNESIDISSDISVLETMMQKDGLGGKQDFNLKRRADEFDMGGAAAVTEE